MLDITRVLNMDGAINWDSFNYLGVPIFKSKTKTSAWLPIVEKIERKIMGWGAVWLNPTGKVVLIKAVLNNYVLYQCSLLLALAQIINQIEGLMRNFLWQGGNNGGGKKFTLVSWKTIKQPWSEGGLHIRDLKIQNLVIGAKLLWNMLVPKPSWRSCVLKCKYFHGPRLRCFDGEPAIKNGASIAKICKKVMPFFTSELH